MKTPERIGGMVSSLALAAILAGCAGGNLPAAEIQITFTVAASLVQTDLPELEPLTQNPQMVEATATMEPIPTHEPTPIIIPEAAVTATDRQVNVENGLEFLPSLEPTAIPTSTPTVQSTATEMPSATPTETATSEPTATETYTPTLAIETSALPTETVQTSTPEAGVTITSVQDTTCRKYPTRNSNPLGNLALDATSSVLGKDSTGDWYFIVNPTNPADRMCWVWSGTLTVSGDPATLEVIPDSIND